MLIGYDVAANDSQSARILALSLLLLIEESTIITACVHHVALSIFQRASGCHLSLLTVIHVQDTGASILSALLGVVA